MSTDRTPPSLVEFTKPGGLRSTLPICFVSAVLAIAGVAGCTATSHVAPSPPSSSPAVAMTGVGLGSCGRDTGNLSGLLAAPEVAPGKSVARSASSVSLDTESCADPELSTSQLASTCDARAFPWAAIGALEKPSLYSLSVRAVKEATFEVNGSPSMRQVVLEPGPGVSTFAALYVDHAKTCGAHVVAFRDGKPIVLQLDSATPLSMAITDGTVTALIGLDGKDKTALLK